MNFINIAQASTETIVEDTSLTHTIVSEENNNVEQGVLGSLGINGQLLTFQFINFGIVVLVLWFLILKPLTKKLAERQQLIDESIENSEKIKKNLEKSEKSYQEKIDQAKVETNKIMEKATLEANNIAEATKSKTRKDIEQLVEQAKKNIHLEKEEMVAGLKTETVEIVMAAVEKILLQKMDDKKDKEMIESALKNLK